MKVRDVPAACGALRERSERGHEHASRERVMNGADEVPGDPRFQHIAPCARSERGCHVGVRSVGGEEHDRRARTHSAEVVQGLEAIQVGHRDVQHNDIRIQVRRDVDGLSATRHGAHNVKILRQESRGRCE